MAVLVLALARRLGMLAEGVNYPGHFLVRIDDALIDPLALTVVDERSLQTIPGFTKSEMLSTASPVTIAFRMLNNLKSYYTAFENWRAALLTTEYQISMVNNEPRLLGLVLRAGRVLAGAKQLRGSARGIRSVREVTTDNELAKRGQFEAGSIDWDDKARYTSHRSNPAIKTVFLGHILEWIVPR